MKQVIISDRDSTKIEIIRNVLDSNKYHCIGVAKTIKDLNQLIEANHTAILVTTNTLERRNDIYFDCLAEKYTHLNYQYIFTSFSTVDYSVYESIFPYISGILSLPISESHLKSSLEKASKALDTDECFLNNLCNLLKNHNYSSSQISKLIAQHLKNYRESHSLTQQEVSDYLGFSIRQVQRIEAGKSNLSLESLIVLMRGLSSSKLSHLSKN